MKRRKNLERAIVLGLLLSTSVYGSAWAEVINETITDNSHNGTYNEDVIVDTNDNSAIEIDDDSISIKTENPITGETGKIELNSNKYGIRLDGNGSVTLTAAGDNIINVTTKEGGSDDVGDGINVTENAGGTITLNGANNTIIVVGEHSDGIYTDIGSNTKIDLIATVGNNTITATNNGIDHRGNGTITLKAENGNNIIKTTNGDGIRVEGPGKVEFNAENNEITAGDNGIQVEGGGTVSVTADNDNVINAVNKGIYVYDANSSVSINGVNNTISVSGGISGNNDYIYGINAKESGKVEVKGSGKAEIDIKDVHGGVRGIYAGKGGNVSIEHGSLEINVVHLDSEGAGNTQDQDRKAYGIAVNTDTMSNEKGDNSQSEVNINTSGNIEFTVSSLSEAKSTAAIYADYGGKVDIESTDGILNFEVTADNSDNGFATSGIYSDKNSAVEINAKKGITITSTDKTQNITSGTVYGVNSRGTKDESTRIEAGSVTLITEGDVNINAIATADKASASAVSSISYSGAENRGSTSIKGNNITLSAVGGKNIKGLSASSSGKNILNAANDILIQSELGEASNRTYAYGIDSFNADNSITSAGDVAVEAIDNGSENTIYGLHTMANGSNDSNTQIEGTSVYISTVAGSDGKAYGIYSENVGSTAQNTEVNINSTGNNLYNNISINSKDAGIYAKNNAGLEAMQIKLEAAGNNFVQVSADDGIGVYSSGADVDLTADNSNILYAGELNSGYGKSYAINAIGQSDVDLTAGETNLLRGAVYASGHTDTAKTDVTLGGGANMVLSNAYIVNAGDLTDKNVISALYAEKGANISLDGDYNILGTYAVSSSDDLERVVWAYDMADIDITGLTAISTDSYDLATNSKDIAVVAGTATGLEELSADEILGYSGDRANVDINYESDSSITGDILSAYAGTVNIAANTETTRAASDSKIDIRGNLLAGNNGILDVNLGNGGTLTGRADDYGDAGLDTGHGAATGTENSFFNPAFSSEIIANGTVNLTMGEGSVWNVTGQSWITELNTTANAEDTLINLENAKEDYNTSASALTIGTLKGNTQFYMNLDGDRSASDMLYIKNANGKYDIYLQEEVTTDEINADGFDGLRFATVGEGSNADFTVKSQGTGSAFDVVYTVGTDSYAGNEENTAYNSTTGGNANTEKPGNASVNDFFGLTDTATEEPPEAATNGIMLMAENEEAADNAANADTGLNEVTNFKIIARAGEELNDTGETILNMSRANYSNAIYMDRLNKRLGEARYINGEEDEGMWVRIRHDRIGKTDAYRSQNSMYELGYDVKQDCDNGERRIGFAVDYMHGDTGYSDIAGKGEINRYGLWLYDTWMGNKGHYVDYVAKWGHLDNEFEIYNSRGLVTGDYTNNVFSISAEYGRKKDMGNDWYIEPQAQLQLARVTGADYVTSQGTKVSVDGINSLIGRAGFRLGKDFGEEKQSTVYIKADVLHEFLGDQDVYVYDKSSDNKWAGISYENEGTWYDVGFGFATMMSKNSYAFLDLEKSFGHDNDETYQINAGVQWTF